MVPRKGSKAVDAETGEVTGTEVAAPRTDWTNIQSAEELKARLIETYGTVHTGKELVGNEFDAAEKEMLVGVPLTVVEFGFSFSDEFTRNGEAAAFAWLRCARMDTLEMVAFSDGSTGIYQQLREFHAKQGFGAIFCKNGLTRSDYTYTDPKTGDTSPATTYYLGS